MKYADLLALGKLVIDRVTETTGLTKFDKHLALKDLDEYLQIARRGVVNSFGERE